MWKLNSPDSLKLYRSSQSNALLGIFFSWVMELKQFSEVSARASHEQNLFGFRQDEKYLSYSDTTFRCEFFSKLRFLIRAVNL